MSIVLVVVKYITLCCDHSSLMLIEYHSLVINRRADYGRGWADYGRGHWHSNRGGQ